MQDEDKEGWNGKDSSGKIEKAFNINIFDFFTPECQLNIMHFFQDNSKFFHSLDLGSITNDPKTRVWKSVELNINFKIPMFHRSIITPDGKIYLIGGVNVLNKNKSIDNTY